MPPPGKDSRNDSNPPVTMGEATDAPGAPGLPTAPGGMIEVENFYAALVESSEDAIIAKDVNGIIRSWNPAAERLYGHSAQDMIGHSIRRLLPPDRLDEEDRILARIRNGERISQLATRRLHRDGTLLDVSITVSPVRDAQGNIVGASKIARDIGPMLENQRRLLESEERLRMLADNIAQFAWIADPEGTVVWYNRRWLDYTGASLAKSDDQVREQVLPEDYREHVRGSFRQSVLTGEDWEDTFPLRGKDGELRWFLSRAQPIRDSQGAIIWWFGTNTDITEQRDQAEQIRLLLLEVNHRSKNMLSTIQALARRSNRDEAGFMARFEDRVRSLAVNQDILVSREWREVPLPDLVRGQTGLMAAAPGAIRSSGPPLALKPRAAEVVGMALHELATNSLKYGALSVDGGRVDIGWDRNEAGFRMWWREHGGPSVATPQRTGFGTRLIRDVPRHNLSATVVLSYDEAGVSWTLHCDLSHLSSDD
ncbi:MAG: hypothetical protein RLZZ08_1117 [Pseudomonadota bacterium]|jgi:PAS domain S-box-containing protein